MPQILPRLGRCAGSILILSLLMAGGCQVLGIIASKAPAPTVPPAYDGLAGQTAAVWVWVDPAIDLDYPRLSLDLASRIQSNLEKARDEGSGRQRKELEGLQFTIVPESIVKYQKRDPTLNMRPITSIAPRLDVDRLIYVEVMDFTTQGGAAPGLLRGEAQVNISAVEIDAARQNATVAFQEQALALAFPDFGASEGTTTLTERVTYEGLGRLIADQATLRFISHPQEDERP